MFECYKYVLPLLKKNQYAKPVRSLNRAYFVYFTITGTLSSPLYKLCCVYLFAEKFINLLIEIQEST